MQNEERATLQLMRSLTQKFLFSQINKPKNRQNVLQIFVGLVGYVYFCKHNLN